MLQELECQTQGTCGPNTKGEPPELDSSERVDTDRPVAKINPNDSVGDGPKEMVEELSRRWAAKDSGTGHEMTDINDSKAMLTDIGEESQASGLDTYNGGVYEPHVACGGGWAAMHSPKHVVPQHVLQADGPMPASYADLTSCRHGVPSTAATLGPEITPSVMALMLESTGCQWERVKGWTLYLFGGGIEEYRTKQEREQTALEGKERLETTSAYALDKEEKQRTCGKSRLASRLILSNLAADADQESVSVFLSKHKQNM